MGGKMLKNKLNLFVLLLILFISIGAISANDDISDNPSLAIEDDTMDLMKNGSISQGLNSEYDSLSFEDACSSSLSCDESEIELESSSSSSDYNSHILGDSDKSFNSIQSLVDSAESGDIILLNGTYAGSGKAININKTLTIDGQGETTLDAKELSGIFIINANDIILKNLKFSNASDSAGIIKGKNNLITNCTFTNNQAYDGGAIYGNCTVTDSRFIDNSAENLGGAIYGKCTITNCTFTNNHAWASGGAIYGGGTITNCNFTQNAINCEYCYDEEVKGGAIYIKIPNSSIVNCIFKENVAKGSYMDDLSIDIGYGGAIAVGSKNCQIENCEFISNIAGRKDISYRSDDECFIEFEGGAIYSSAPNLKVTNCIFNYNKAYYGYGGAIYSRSSNSTILNCEFNGNSAGEDGGAIFWKVNEKGIKNCNFTNNKSPREKDMGGLYTIKVSKTGKYAGNIVLTMKVYNAITNKPAKNQNITLTFKNSKGKKIHRYAKTNAKGMVKYSVALPTGKYTVTFESKYGLMFNAKNKKATISIAVKAYKAKLSASKLTTTYKSGKTFNVKVKNVKTKQKPTNVKIALKVYTGKKSKVYYALTKKGVARFDLSNVSVGTHKVLAYSALKGVKANKIKRNVLIKKHKFKIVAPKVKNEFDKLKYFKVKVISKNTKKPAKYLKLKLIVYTGKKYDIYDWMRTDEYGELYFSTNALSKGTHKVIIKSNDKNCIFKKKSSIVIV